MINLQPKGYPPGRARGWMCCSVALLGTLWKQYRHTTLDLSLQGGKLVEKDIKDEDAN